MPFNLPLVLTYLRFLMIPLFYQLFYYDKFLALLIYLLAGFTDWLDGYLARKYHVVTSLGKVLDPLADKLLLLTVLFVLAKDGYLVSWVFWLVAAKEVFMIIAAAMLYSKKIILSANWFGKVTTAAFFAAVILTYVDTGFHILFYAAVGLMLIALLSYIYEFLKMQQ